MGLATQFSGHHTIEWKGLTDLEMQDIQKNGFRIFAFESGITETIVQVWETAQVCSHPSLVVVGDQNEEYGCSIFWLPFFLFLMRNRWHSCPLLPPADVPWRVGHWQRCCCTPGNDGQELEIPQGVCQHHHGGAPHRICRVERDRHSLWRSAFSSPALEQRLNMLTLLVAAFCNCPLF